MFHCLCCPGRSLNLEDKCAGPECMISLVSCLLTFSLGWTLAPTLRFFKIKVRSQSCSHQWDAMIRDSYFPTLDWEDILKASAFPYRFCHMRGPPPPPFFHLFLECNILNAWRRMQIFSRMWCSHSQSSFIQMWQDSATLLHAATVHQNSFIQQT